MLGYSKKIILLFLGMFFIPFYTFAYIDEFDLLNDGRLPLGFWDKTTTGWKSFYSGGSQWIPINHIYDWNVFILGASPTWKSGYYNCPVGGGDVHLYTFTDVGIVEGDNEGAVSAVAELRIDYTCSAEGVITDGFDIYDGSLFYYLDPSGNEVVPDSSENIFYAGLYLTEDDYEPNMFIRLKYVRQQDLQAAVANTDLLWVSFDLNDVITSGYNFVSTSTGDLGLKGVYYFTAELRKDPAWYTTAFSWINPFSSLDPDIVVSSTTTFIYDEMTTFDQFVASTTQNIVDYMASSTLDFEQAKNSCWSLSGFDFTDCMNFIFGWQQIPMSNAINNIKDNFFTYAPFGYVKRTYEIMSTTSTSTLPVLSYTFPNDSRFGDMANKEFSFDIWQYFYTDGAPVKDEIKSLGTNKDIWEIFGPITQIIVYMTLLVLIIRDLLDLNLGRHPKDNL